MSDATAKEERCAKCGHLIGRSRVYVAADMYHPTCAPDPEITGLRAALDEALEVVKPFGDRAAAWKHNADSARVSVRLADLRAARRFYEKHKGGGGGK